MANISDESKELKKQIINWQDKFKSLQEKTEKENWTLVQAKSAKEIFIGRLKKM